MKVLIGCEFSGLVRDAFIARGHEAISCDLLPSERPGPHYQGDVRDIINEDWDMGIFFPSCTYLTVSGNRWMTDNYERYISRMEGAKFFIDMYFAPIDKVSVENPIGVMSGFFRKPDQIIQPWMSGHGETKATCLWLRNLPKLIPTNIVDGREERIFKMTPSPDRWKERSRTFEGLAKAMANQWG